jgi:Lrp/AsnC family transcriptional regulator for asnA, asnC and gidA
MVGAMKLDPLDHDIVSLLSSDPGISIVQVSRRLGVARATVQARLDKLHAAGVIRSDAPQLDPTAFGFGVMAMCEIQIEQGAGREALHATLEAIPEIIDAYTTAGEADILARIVVRSNADLQDVIDRIAAIPVVQRTRSELILTTCFEGKTLPLLALAAGVAPGRADGRRASERSATR